MSTQVPKLRLLATLTIAACYFSPSVQATTITLPSASTSAVLYGDFYSYSLPILAWQYDQLNGGGVGPGNPFYVTSTPGAIQNDVVVATGASGSGVNTNFAGMNDAYATPSGNGGLPYFSTGQTSLHPTGSGGLAGAADQNTTWNATLASLTGYLGGSAGLLNSMVLMFNNNEINSGGGAFQSLLAWAQISLRDTDGNLPTQYFTFANNCPAGNVCLSGGVIGSTGGIVSGPDKDPALYSRPATDNSYPIGPVGSTPSLSDFVISGGNVCLTATGVVVDCSDPSVAETINHNLGANQAAYAVFSPELDSQLNKWWNGGSGGGTGYDVLSIDFRMGCNSEFAQRCTNAQMIDNGYEQLFMARGILPPPPPEDVPEPHSAALIALGLLALSWQIRRIQATRLLA
ncbi:hypothetical protein HNQ59_001395 [Chitinivorax tropicus]|uniref:Ice-binding protein C-terminal domain-containing protein n=1 Tax=Chitinivorax tropicus TaxID=714531 RepID=A0A840MI81_9PROT|nr:PEP-CTERM sorting domain-containing protein [Chitinivorax tropicus]MBB5018110.1 hypothetical protein [Chitinivorax tropicus]